PGWSAMSQPCGASERHNCERASPIALNTVTPVVLTPPTRTPASHRGVKPRRSETSPIGHGALSAKPTSVWPGASVRAPVRLVVDAQAQSASASASVALFGLHIRGEAGAHLAGLAPDEVVVGGVVE